MNILLIDDEPLILQNVYDQIVKMELPIDRIFTAGSAKEARTILCEYPVDIFLCDIVMPLEDGITFAKKTLETYPDSKFIFLTGHSDYEYMKEAICIQSFDYILQPTTKEELQDVLERAMLKLSLEEQKRKILETHSILLDNETDILEENAFCCICGEQEKTVYLKQSIELRTGKIESDTVFLPFYIKVLSTKQRWKKEERALLRGIYYNIMDELAEPLASRSIVLLHKELTGEACVLLRFSGAVKTEPSAFDGLMENMRILFQKLLNMEIAIYYGEVCSFENIFREMDSIAGAIDECVQNISAVWKSGIKRKTDYYNSMENQAISWRALLNKNQITEFKNSLFRYLDYHAKCNTVNREFLIKLHQCIVELLMGKMAVCQVDSSGIFGQEVTYYDFMYCFRDVEKFRKIVGYVLDKLGAASGVDQEDPMNQVIRYIRENIEKDISVNELSDMAGMSSEYFSRAFKKRTGLSPKKYIVKEKMEAAKNLLVSTSLPVMLISEHVGYANYSNFTFTFRQFFGCTPSEYRRR